MWGWFNFWGGNLHIVWLKNPPTWLLFSYLQIILINTFILKVIYMKSEGMYFRINTLSSKYSKYLRNHLLLVYNFVIVDSGVMLQSSVRRIKGSLFQVSTCHFDYTCKTSLDNCLLSVICDNRKMEGHKTLDLHVYI